MIGFSIWHWLVILLIVAFVVGGVRWRRRRRRAQAPTRFPTSPGT